MASLMELLLELLVGLALVALGFACVWIARGEAAFDVDANTAWGVGFVAVTVFSTGFLATREVLERRRKRLRGF